MRHAQLNHARVQRLGPEHPACPNGWQVELVALDNDGIGIVTLVQWFADQHGVSDQEMEQHLQECAEMFLGFEALVTSDYEHEAARELHALSMGSGKPVH